MVDSNFRSKANAKRLFRLYGGFTKEQNEAPFNQARANVMQKKLGVLPYSVKSR